MEIRSLPPGFRFHPTDVELVKYYLKRKVLGKRFPVEAIAEVDIYKFAPWDLRDKACWAKDLKWYFFCPRGRKYATGARTNRSTEFGHWKTTGKDRPVLYNGKTVGMIKSLIFHRGPKRERTDWVMHEYRLDDKDLQGKEVPQDAYVLCMIYQKDGPGPRNGAQYGAPYKEEDSDDEDDAEGSHANRIPQTGSGTPAFMLPEKRDLSSAVGITNPEINCVGSSSKTCPAGPIQTVQSDKNVPLAPGNDDPMDGQALDGEEDHFDGIFSHEIPDPSCHNERIESLDGSNLDGSLKAAQPLTGNDIYDDLEDIEVAIYHNGSSFDVRHEAQYKTNVFVRSESYLELKDFETPVDDQFTYLGSNAPQNFSSSPQVTPDAEHLPVLELMDLETPLTCFNKAGQSNVPEMNGLLSYLCGYSDVNGLNAMPHASVFPERCDDSQVSRVTEHIPCLDQHLQPEMCHAFKGHLLQGGNGVEEYANQESGIQGAALYDGATSGNCSEFQSMPAFEDPRRGLYSTTLHHMLEYPAHPSSAAEHLAPDSGGNEFEGSILSSFPCGDSSIHVKAEVTLGGGAGGCTEDALLYGWEGFPFDCAEYGSRSRIDAANCGCGTWLLLVMRALSVSVISAVVRIVTFINLTVLAMSISLNIPCSTEQILIWHLSSMVVFASFLTPSWLAACFRIGDFFCLFHCFLTLVFPSSKIYSQFYQAFYMLESLTTCLVRASILV